jgi:transposase
MESSLKSSVKNVAAKPPVRQYTLEYKQEAVQLVLSGVKPVEVARRLEIPQQNITNWLRLHHKSALGTAPRKPVSAEQAEISRLRAELAEARMERDFLKKAAAYFAKA